MYDTVKKKKPHLVPTHDLSYAYNLFVLGFPTIASLVLDDRLFPAILYPLRIWVLTLACRLWLFSFRNWCTHFQWRLDAGSPVSSICNRFGWQEASMTACSDDWSFSAGPGPPLTYLTTVTISESHSHTPDHPSPSQSYPFLQIAKRRSTTRWCKPTMRYRCR
jgi:hypothetical protein